VHQEDVLVDQWWLGYAQRCPEKLPTKPFLKDTENKITLKEKTLQSAPLNHPAKPFCPI
jgi:hypothetical protein